MNQSQGSIFETISAEPGTEDVDVAIITCRGAMTGEDGPRLQVRLDGKNKASFDIATEKDTFFEARDAIGRNHGKSLFTQEKDEKRDAHEY